MANRITGKNVIFEILISAVYYPIFCGKSAEIILNQDEVEVTHVNSGNDREYVPGMSNSTVSASGVSVLDNTEGRIAVTYLMQAAIRRTINTYRWRMIDQDGDSSTITFNAFWTTGGISRDVTAWSQSNVTMRITGALTFGSVVTPPDPPACEIEDPIVTVLLSGASTVVSALLVPGVGETITILHVTRSGMTHYEVVGTPGSLEFAYDSATGTISFDPLNPGNPGNEPVSIEYKIET